MEGEWEESGGDFNDNCGLQLQYVPHIVQGCDVMWKKLSRCVKRMLRFTEIKMSSQFGVRHSALLLGDGEGGDLCWVSIVLAIKRCVHGEFAPEDQLALPSVACGHKNKHLKKQHF